MGKYSDWRRKPYIQKNKRHESFCVYCGKNADTREHIPPKVFLDETLDSDYQIVPACFSCNNGFSEDELYIACLISKIWIAFNKGGNEREKVVAALKHDEKLGRELQEKVRVDGEKVCVILDTKRIRRILLKLALCHMVNRHDNLFEMSDERIIINFCLKQDMTDEEIKKFESWPEINIVPESCFDYMEDLLVFEPVGGGVSKTVCPWKTIQESNYRYLTYIADDHTSRVRIVIMETLCCEVIIPDEIVN